MNWITSGDAIMFGHKFNERLDNELISGFKKLLFSNHTLSKILFENYINDYYDSFYCYPSEFNQDVSELPQSLTIIKFGHMFNQDVSALPHTLTHLYFGHDFNQDVSALPHTLTHLYFGHDFNQDVSNLPQTLISIDLGVNFNQQSNIGPYIKYLKLNCNNQYIIDSLPNSIIELKLEFNFNLRIDNLPTSIKKLVFSMESDYNKDLNSLPNFIEELHLPNSYSKPILNIPTNLKKLVCCKKYKHRLDFANKGVQVFTFEY